MPLQVSPPTLPVPLPVPGAPPRAAARHVHTATGDGIAAPTAHPSLPIAPPPRHPVDGTPEVIAAGLGLGALALGTGGAAIGTAAAVRSGTSYVARLAQTIVKCVADPVKTGEHIAEGIVGGAAWAAAATGVTALAEAAHARAAAQPQHPPR